MQRISASYGRISTKFFGGVGPIDQFFGSDPDHDSDPGFLNGHRDQCLR